MTTTAAGERCVRCHQPVAPLVRRCPHCGERRQDVDFRRITIYLGVAGIICILLLVILGLFLNPPMVDSGNRPADATEKGAPAVPAKKPPLN